VLVDVRQQLERYVAPDVFGIHFSGIRNPWSRRSLLAAGFGTSNAGAKPVFSIADIHAASLGGGASAHIAAGSPVEKDDIEIARDPVERDPRRRTGVAARVPVLSVATPTFHADLDEALAVRPFSSLRVASRS
jgi:sodium-independent sulfate anion transporter 11